MNKHISDQHRMHGHARLREYTRHERETGMHPAILALRSRPQKRGEANRKTAEFLRIARNRLS